MTVKPLYDAFRDYISMRDDEITRDWFDRFDWNLSERNLRSELIPAVGEVPEVLSCCGKGEERLVKLFVAMRNQLHWLQSYTADDFGQYMVDHYGFVELIGTRGHYASTEIAAGFVFFGQGVNYPNHWHGSEAIYYPMTDTGLWSQDNGEYETKKAGEIVYHEPNEHHALKVPENPLLAIWIWRGGNLAQKSDY